MVNNEADVLGNDQCFHHDADPEETGTEWGLEVDRTNICRCHEAWIQSAFRDDLLGEDYEGASMGTTAVCVSLGTRGWDCEMFGSRVPWTGCEEGVVAVRVRPSGRPQHRPLLFLTLPSTFLSIFFTRPQEPFA